MFEEWKRKRAAKKAKDQAIAEAQYWKNHPRLRVCLQAMRGSCTLASQELHEAAIAVVNIALMEGAWETVDAVQADFMEGAVFLVWNDEKENLFIYEYFKDIPAVKQYLKEQGILIKDVFPSQGAITAALEEIQEQRPDDISFMLEGFTVVSD